MLSHAITNKNEHSKILNTVTTDSLLASSNVQSYTIPINPKLVVYKRWNQYLDSIAMGVIGTCQPLINIWATFESVFSFEFLLYAPSGDMHFTLLHNETFRFVFVSPPLDNRIKRFHMRHLILMFSLDVCQVTVDTDSCTEPAADFRLTN